MKIPMFTPKLGTWMRWYIQNTHTLHKQLKKATKLPQIIDLPSLVPFWIRLNTHTHKQPPPPPNRNNIYNTFWESSSPKTLRQLNVFNASHLYPTDPKCHARGPAFEPVTFCICASSFSPSTSWSSWLPVEVSMGNFLERERKQEIKTSINLWNTISNSSFVPDFFSKR